MKKSKIYAAYLPQYHEIKENNEFWGKGFTDWVGVKNSKSQFKGHKQPKVPLNENYYDLSDWEVMEWQANLAKKNGIDGFCIYHYWFKDSHKVLEKPAENLLKHEEIDIGYFFSWDNHSWIRSWSNIAGNPWAPTFENPSEKEKNIPILLECDYGDSEEWEKHFEYLLPFFKDNRYLKINNKPVFMFFSDNNPYTIKKMAELWEKLAIDNGFLGIFFMVQKAPFFNKHIFKNQFVYQPLGLWNRKKAIERRIRLIFSFRQSQKKLNRINYDRAWRKILWQTKIWAKKDIYFSGIVRYDDSPRRGENANILVGDTPSRFGYYFSKFYEINCLYNKEFLVLTAWNEWGEGAYLEPDTDTGNQYLEEIKKVVGIEENT